MSKARDIADLDFNAPDIDGGNIDGAVIGGTTPAAATFSGLTVNGNPIITNLSPQLFFQTGSGNTNFQLAAQENINNGFEISTGGTGSNAPSETYTPRLTIASTGAATFSSTVTSTGLTSSGGGSISGNLLVGASTAAGKLTVGTFGDTARAAQFHGGSILVDGGAASEIIIGDGNVAYMSIQTTDNATAMKIRDFSGNADLVTIERATGAATFSNNIAVGASLNTGWASNYKAIQIGNAGAVWSEDASSSNTLISNNEVYNTNGSYYRLVAGAANDILLVNDGSFQFRSTATSAAANAIISDQTTKMKIASNGYVEMVSASQVRLTLGSEGTAGSNTANWIRGNGTSLGYNSAGGNHAWEVSGTPRMTLGAGGDLTVEGPVSIKNNRLTLDSDYDVRGQYQTLVCHNTITGNQAWTDVAFVSYSPSLTIQGTVLRDNNGSLGQLNYFGTIFGGYGAVTVTATTVVNQPMNGGGMSGLEYRYLNGGATSGAYRLQVRMSITAGTMYVTTTLTGHAFNQITED